MKEIRERVAYNDGSYFLIIYDGTPIDLTIDEEKEVERNLRMFMDNKEIHNDIIKNVSFLRTIFIDFDEHYFYIKYHDKNKDEYVEYKNKELTLYDCIENEKEKNIKGKNKQKIKKPYKSKSDIWNELKNIGHIGIGEEEYKLIDAYNYFYGLHPNFSLKYTNILFQCMILILKKKGINILDNDDYVLDDEIGIPVSPTIDKIVNNLYPYGMISTVGNAILDEDKEKILLVGSEIQKEMNTIDRMKTLIKLTKLLYENDDELIKREEKVLKK